MVVLPTPPLPDVTTMIFATGQLLIIWYYYIYQFSNLKNTLCSTVFFIIAVIFTLFINDLLPVKI
ncbi:hypothetical protein [Moraxella lacunata]|uniref:hypothetical protein n=1 Tax=Moraxella lacunata TaxID=477 RepID=UPI003EE2D1B7